jgi:hypothetical protein
MMPSITIVAVAICLVCRDRFAQEVCQRVVDARVS